MSGPLIRVRGADLGYRAAPVLRGVDLEVRAGEFVGLVGPNGCGKTTLLKSMLGLLPPLAGTVEADTTRRFAYVPQQEEINLLWPLSVRETVELAERSRRPLGRLEPEAAKAAEQAMARTGVLAIAERALASVSGGQRQRTILAQALSQRPDVLLLDEPTRGLDVLAEAEFLDLLQDLRKQEGLTIVFVTHSLAIPINHASTVVLFKDGAVFSATPDDLQKTRRLEEIYGAPFVHVESDGQRWTAPRRKP